MAGSNAGHEWNVLLKEDGTFYPFDAVNKGFKFDYSFRKIAKVFRKTYQAQNIKLTNQSTDELTSSFSNYFRKDVTNEYVKTFDIKVPIDKFHRKGDYAVISTFDNKNWAPQYWGEVNGNKAFFKNMGVDIIYSAFYYDKGQYHRASEPFLLDSLGQTHSLRADENQLQDKIPFDFLYEKYYGSLATVYKEYRRNYRRS